MVSPGAQDISQWHNLMSVAQYLEIFMNKRQKGAPLMRRTHESNRFFCGYVEED